MLKIGERQYLSPGAETISVEVAESGTVHLVTYDIDDGAQTGTLHKGEQLDIRVSPAEPRRKLTLLFTFSGDSGGLYDVTLSGSLGGGDTDPVDQGSFGIPATTSEYRFRLQQ